MADSTQSQKLPAFKTLAAARLREVMHYNPETGIFTWRVNRARQKCAGRVAGTIGPDGRLIVRIDYRIHYLSRLAWLYVTGEWPAKLVDHRNGDRADNKWSNLRAASHAENARNSARYKPNKTGYRGVNYVAARGKYRGVIEIKGRSVYLGLYETAEAAHEAYLAAVRKHHGEFGYTREIPPVTGG